MRVANIKYILALSLLAVMSCTPPPPTISNNQSNRNAGAQANANAQPNSNGRNTQVNSNSAQAQSKPKPGTANLEVNSTPTGAVIMFVPLREGGADPPQQQGLTPNTVNVPAGKYYITLELSGYRAFTQTVTVRNGETKKINATLKKR